MDGAENAREVRLCGIRRVARNDLVRSPVSDGEGLPFRDIYEPAACREVVLPPMVRSSWCSSGARPTKTLSG